VLRIRDRTIVGFSVLVQGLTAEESVQLQEEGIGGRGKMGCGFFLPARGN
jgi:CRISPR-associated protein Cas6